MNNFDITKDYVFNVDSHQCEITCQYWGKNFTVGVDQFCTGYHKLVDKIGYDEACRILTKEIIEYVSDLHSKIVCVEKVKTKSEAPFCTFKIVQDIENLEQGYYHDEEYTYYVHHTKEIFLFDWFEFYHPKGYYPTAKVPFITTDVERRINQPEDLIEEYNFMKRCDAFDEHSSTNYRNYIDG
jgi:hypothetical protein